MVGGLRKEKGLDLLVYALAQTKGISNAHILVVGEAKDETYVATCKLQLRANNGHKNKELDHEQV